MSLPGKRLADNVQRMQVRRHSLDLSIQVMQNKMARLREIDIEEVPVQGVAPEETTNPNKEEGNEEAESSSAAGGNNGRLTASGELTERRSGIDRRSSNERRSGIDRRASDLGSGEYQHS